MPYVDPQHRTRQSGASSSDRSSTERRRAAGQGYAAGSAALRPSERRPPEQQEEGWLGWLGRKANEAGDWASEQADGARRWASETASDVSDWAGEQADKVRSAWDTASNTDLDVDRRGVGLSMRVQDLRKMLPPEALEQIQFDEEHLDDRIQARYEYGNDYVTLTAPSLALSGLSVADLQTGAASAADVTVVVSNPGGKLPFVEDGWQNSGNLMMDVQIGTARAENIRYADVLRAQSLELQGLAVAGGAPTSRVLGSGGGVISGGFTVERAVLRGAEAAGASVGEVSVTDGSANWRDDTNQARVSAGEIGVTDLQQGDSRVGSARVTDLSANTTGAMGNLTASSLSLGQMGAGRDTIGGASADGISAAWDGNSRSISATAERAGIRNTNISGTTLQSVDGTGITFAQNLNEQGTGRMDIGAEQVGATGLRVGDDLALSSVALQGASWTSDTANQTEAARATSGTATGLAVDGFDAQTLQVSDASYFQNRASGDLRTGASVVTGSGMNAGPVAIQQGRVDNVAYRNNVFSGTGGTTATSARLDGLSSAYGTADNATIDGLRLTHGPDRFGVNVDQLRSEALASQYGNASALSAGGLGFQTGPDGSRLRTDELALYGGTSQYGSFDAASARGLDARSQVVNGQTVSTANLDAAGVRNLQSQYGSARALDLTGIGVHNSADGTRGHLDALDGSGLQYGDLASVERARLDGLAFARNQGSTQTNLALRSANLSGTSVQSGSSTLNIADTQLNGGIASLGEQSVYDLQRARMIGVSGSWQGQGGAPIQIPGVDFSQHQLDASLGLNAGAITLGDTRQTVRDVGGLVDDADIRLGMPLVTADYGPIEVRPNTALDARVAIQDGRLVPGQTEARLSRGLDGPLWTSVDGIYLDRAGRSGTEGKLKADVGGFFDQNISDEVMATLGRDQNRVPLSVAELSALGAARMPAGQTNAQPGGQTTGQVVLARERNTDNTVQIRSNAQGAVASFVRMLVSSVSVQVGGSQVQTGRTAVTGATVRSQGNPTQPDLITGNIEALEVEQLRATTRGE